MKVQLLIETGNAALVGPAAPGEVARILRRAAEHVEGTFPGTVEGVYPLFDINGNRVGTVRVEWDDRVNDPD